MKGSGQSPLETEFLLYQAENGSIRIEARLQNETLWLGLSQMADLFAIDKSGISRHLKNVFESGELKRTAKLSSGTLQSGCDHFGRIQSEQHSGHSVSNVGD